MYAHVEDILCACAYVCRKIKRDIFERIHLNADVLDEKKNCCTFG